MLPFKGIYLLLILAGSADVPERIGLEQQLDMQRCQINAQRAVAQNKYFFVRCIVEGAIVSDSLADLPPPDHTKRRLPNMSPELLPRDW